MVMSYRLKGSLIFFFSLIILIYGMILRDAPTSAATAAIGTKTTVYLKANFFYFIYLLLQIPFGFLFDRYSFRKLYFWIILIAGIGAIIPIFSNALIGTGYFLIVAPLAAVFVGAMVTASRWFTHRFFAIAIGFTQLFAAIGILVGLEPLIHLVNHQGLGPVMVTAGIIGIVFAILSLLIFRDNSLEKPPPFDKVHYVDEIKTFLRSKQVWWIAIYSLFSWGTVDIFGGQWGGPFLKAKFNYSIPEMNMILAMFWFGFGLLSPLFGWISEVLDNRLTILRIGPLLGMICSIILLYLPLTSRANVAFLFFGVGIVGAAHMLTFALMKDLFSLRIIGFALGFVNFFVVIGRQIFGPLTTFYFKLTGAGTTPSLTEMKEIFVLIPIFFALSFIASLFFKETHCLQTDENH